MSKKAYSFDEIDDIVDTYKSSTGQERSAALDTLLAILQPYLLKYVKMLKSDSKSEYDNKDAKEFLSLFLSKKNKESKAKSFADVKRLLVGTLSAYSIEDLYSELTVIIIVLLDKYERRPGINCMRYLTRYFRYYVRNWIVRISRDPLFHVDEEEMLENKESYNLDAFYDTAPITRSEFFKERSLAHEVDTDASVNIGELTLGGILLGSGWLLNHLTNYQRYLLYLYYARGHSCVDIANRLYKNKDTISTHLKKATRKLKIVSEKQYGRKRY